LDIPKSYLRNEPETVYDLSILKSLIPYIWCLVERAIDVPVDPPSMDRIQLVDLSGRNGSSEECAFRVLGQTKISCRGGSFMDIGFDCCNIEIQIGLPFEQFVSVLIHEFAHVVVHWLGKHPADTRLAKTPYVQQSDVEEGLCVITQLIIAGHLNNSETFRRNSITDSLMDGRGLTGTYGDNFNKVKRHMSNESCTLKETFESYLRNGAFYW